MNDDRRIKDEVHDLIVRFANASDDGDVERLSPLLTDDAAISVPARGVLMGPGRDAVLASLHSTVSARAAQGERGRHLLTNICIEVGSDAEATARSYVTFVVTSADGSVRFHAFATYDDRFVRTGDEWCLAVREIVFDQDRLQPPPAGHEGLDRGGGSATPEGKGS